MSVKVKYYCWYRKGTGHPVAAFLNPENARGWADNPNLYIMIPRTFRWPSAEPILESNKGGRAYELLCAIVDSDCETIDDTMRQAEAYVVATRKQIDYQI